MTCRWNRQGWRPTRGSRRWRGALFRENFKALVVALLAAFTLHSHAAEGLVAVNSPHTTAETSNRLVAALQARGLKLFARIDHAAGAATLGKTLRPTEVFIFGNP